MKKRKNKISALSVGAFFSTAALTIVSAVSCSIVDSDPIKKDIVVYSTNDIHGRFKKDESNNVAGLESISGYLAVNNNYDLLLDAGDFYQGTAISNYDKGETAFKIADEMDYDAIALGNHEFDYGFENIKKLVNNAKIPWLAANVKYKNNNEPVFKGHEIITIKDGLKVGVIGLVTNETEITTHPDNVKDVYFEDVVVSATEQIKQIKEQGINFIVLLTHTGPEDAERLANELGDDIDLIVDGHSQIAYEKIINNTYIVQTGEYAQTLRRSNFDFNTESGLIENWETSLILYDELTQQKYLDSTPATIKELIEKQEQALDNEFNEVVVENLPFTLNGQREDIRNRETNLGNFVADAFVDEANKFLSNEEKVHFGLTNSGGIRTSLLNGEITKRNTYNVFPFGNTLVVLEVTGQQIKDAIEYSVSRIGQGSFLQISENLKITIEKNLITTETPQTYKYTLKSLQIKENESTYKDIDLNAKYRIVTTNFISTGGDGYSMLDVNNPNNNIIQISLTNNGQTIAPIENKTALENYLIKVFGSSSDETLKNKYKDDNINTRIIFENIQNTLEQPLVTYYRSKLYWI